MATIRGRMERSLMQRSSAAEQQDETDSSRLRELLVARSQEEFENDADWPRKGQGGTSSRLKERGKVLYCRA
jgi:hypothetical protein